MNMIISWCWSGKRAGAHSEQIGNRYQDTPAGVPIRLAMLVGSARSRRLYSRNGEWQAAVA